MLSFTGLRVLFIPPVWVLWFSRKTSSKELALRMLGNLGKSLERPLVVQEMRWIPPPITTGTGFRAASGCLQRQRWLGGCASTSHGTT